MVRCATKYIIDNDLHDKAFLNDWVDNYEDYYKSLELFTMDFAEETTGIPKEQIISFAEEAQKNQCQFVGQWVLHNKILVVIQAISNLLLVTGNYRKPGSGAYPLRGHNNVQGASDMGSMPDQFPGYQKVMMK